MGEICFPLAAVAATFLVLVPLLTLISRAALALSRRRATSWPGFGSKTTFAWLVAPTLLPVIWLTSSAFPRSAPTRLIDACLVSHENTALCTDTLVLLGLMLAGMLGIVSLRLWREWPRAALRRLGNDDALARTVARITRADPHLRSLRVAVVRASSEPIYTLGFLRPFVVVDACFVREADAQVLHAALLHEHAHIAGFDTLRNFVVRLCLSINPAGALLKADYGRWRSAREAMCDGEAVQLGGEALALAEGIVKAARFRCVDLAVPGVALCGHDAAALKLRLALLLNGPPAPVRTFGHLLLTLGSLAALAVPHIDGLGLLDHFHFEVERLLHALL